MKTLIFLSFCLFALSLSAQDRPNILVLMFEDTSADNLSAFGNTVIETPNFDALAAKGIMFTNAYSNGPQCSTARSTFIRGMYATTVGATWHRKDVKTPDEFYFPRTLQKNGYNTYLKGKHDFNTAIGTWGPNGLKIFDDLWYKDCPDSIPFYGQYNFFDTHMSKITDSRKPGERDNRTVDASEVDDASIEPYLPPTEWVVDDYAYHLHRVKQFDTWLKKELATLEATGRADNTIIFVTSDHGGCHPGSKAYLREDGVEIPLIAYYPPKWASLEPINKDGICDELVEFADFGPTICSLAGIDKLDYMQGRIFCGPNREEPKEYAYLYRANQGSNYIPSRAITDGKYKLIWNCNTVFPSGARQSFQWQMPSYRDWESHYRKGEYTGIQSYFFEPMVPFEFYDLESDPYETINLASDPAYAELLDEHIAALQAKVRSTNDISFFPNSIRNVDLKDVNLYDWVRDNDYDMEQLYQAVELASMAEAEDLDAVVELLKNPETVIRYWGAVGMLRLRFHDKISDLPALVKDLAHNTSENIEVRCLSHMALLCNEDYCECSAFIASNLEETYCQGIIPNVGDKLIPIAGEIYTAGMKTSDFYVKSALINAGVMPYEQLIDVSNVTINQALLDSVGKVDCQEDECSNLVSDNFSSESDLDNWIESPTTDMVNVNGGVLNVLFNKTKENTSVQRNFSAVSNDYLEFNFTCSFDDNASLTYFSLLNEQGKVVASFISGIIGSGGFFAVSELNDLDKRVEQSNVKTSENFAKGGFTKKTNFNASIRINNVDQTFTVVVNSYVSSVYPLINSATGITGMIVYVEKMYNNNAGAHIDNFSVTSTSPEKIALSTIIQEVQIALFDTHFGMTDEDQMTEWSSLLEAYLSATDMINNCTTLSAEYASAKSVLDNAYTAYQEAIPLQIKESTSPVIESSLPEVFYIGDGYFKPELASSVNNYQFNIYNLNGTKVFSSQNQERGWTGSYATSPMHFWSLQYQTLDNKTVLQSGKVMVFVD